MSEQTRGTQTKTSLEDAHYKRARRDPIARLVLEALHKQDAATYNGNAGDIGALALQTAAKIRTRREAR